MSTEASPLDYFKEWLPGEMRYIAKKHPYVSLVEDSRRPADDPRSINGRLSGEWFIHQFMRRHGNHHAPTHQKTAQSQLAKFAAGLFTTAAVARWIANGSEPETEAYLVQADRVAETVCQSTLTGMDIGRFNPAAEIDKPYEETVFQNGVISLMRRIVMISEAADTTRRPEQASALNFDALSYGQMALQCYVAYARTDLTPDQYYLAPSQLAD